LKPFGSSTLSDMALIPYPSIKMGPGDSARSHTAGEYILKSELDKGLAAYCHFLEHIEL
jgi:acetylornithine deacetylase